MVTVRISEVYDLATRIGKVGLIGIHTPSTATVKAMYGGLWESYRYVRLKKCDVTIACASMLPADPLQVGTEAGDIAPQDMFNPILYKACSNDSFDSVVSRIYQASTQLNESGHNVSVSPEAFSVDNQEGIYYTLLADRGWKKAMPQAGLSMRGLVPLVYPVLNAFGNLMQPSASALGSVPVMSADGSITVATGVAGTFRGRPVRMPRLPTKVGSASSEFAPVDTKLYNAFVGCLVMPPSRLHELYYRLRVSWTLDFFSVRPYNEISPIAGIVVDSSTFYYDGTNFASSKEADNMESIEDMVSTNDVDLTKVMVG